jgi:hypothetical protein
MQTNVSVLALSFAPLLMDAGEIYTETLEV